MFNFMDLNGRKRQANHADVNVQIKRQRALSDSFENIDLISGGFMHGDSAVNSTMLGTVDIASSRLSNVFCEINLESAKKVNENQQNATPVEKILPWKEFRKLPKPNDIGPSLTLTRSYTHFVQPTITNEDLNDSLDRLKNALMVNKRTTPLTFSETPQTPEGYYCDDSASPNTKKMDKIDVELNYASLIRKNGLRRAISDSPFAIDPVVYCNRIPTYAKCPQIENPIPVVIDQRSIKRISAEELAEIIKNEFSTESDAFYIVDCRYPYEYNGGHINGAVNLYTIWQMLNYIFLKNFDPNILNLPLTDTEASLKYVIDKTLQQNMKTMKCKQKAFVFHCEFSSIRGPEMAECMREMDRRANLDKYPQLFFPKIYILDKGYKEFYNKFKHLCKPRNYVPMDCGKNDDPDEMESDSSFVAIDEATKKLRIEQYNECKREAHDQKLIFKSILGSNKQG